MTALPAAADRAFLRQALALGALGEGGTSPNPRVGCLVVRDGSVVGRGFHQAPGLPHAEALALAEAGARARGGTLYVNLEPCAHQGRTPPCAGVIAASGIARVVASIQDPNPLVDGRGFAMLRGAGIEVEVGLLAEEAQLLNDAFFHHHQQGRPLVTLKAAISLDGMLSAADGRSRWITGIEARRFAHRLRLRHDAVLVGAGTVRRDDPLLTIRLPGVHASRLRAVLAPTLDVPVEARLFQRASADTGQSPRVYATASADAEKAQHLGQRAEIVRVGGDDQRLDLREVLSDLSRLGVQSVLVEGGGRTLAAFVEAGLADRAAIFVAPRLIGARGGTPLWDRSSAPDPAAAWRLEPTQRIPLGSDVLTLGRLVGPA